MFNIITFYRHLKYCPHPSKLEYKCRKLVMGGANQALYIFNDKDVRRLLNFDKVDTEEQNRFFNEFTVTNIVLLMLILEYKIAGAEDDLRKEYLQALKAHVPKYYIGMLARFGIEKQYIDDWEKLIGLRYEEYDDEILEWRREIMNEENAPEALQKIASEKALLIFQAVSFGLYRHLRRSKVEPQDRLYIRVQDYLSPIFKELMLKSG
ncbi:MAG: hypothetical protein V1928_02260 [Parcubacteria group bacterium]